MPQITVSLSDPEPVGRKFVGREALITGFETALDTLTPDRHSVLMFYGVGGIGKSALIRELRRRLREERPASLPPAVHARVDFTDPESRLPTTALVRARSDLHRQGVPFLSFDIAFAHYWSLAYPHLPLSKSELRFLEEGEMLADLVDAAAEIPGLGLVSKIPRALGKTRKVFQTYWHKRGQEELRRIAALDDADKVVDWLYVFWAADVKAWLAEEPGRRAVLLLDTLEALGASDGGGVRGTAPDDWVREWAGHLDGVLVTIAGRQKLRWRDRDASWGAMIDQHLVGSLAPEDAGDFLRAAGVVEPDVRATIIAQSEGVPLYLDLAVDTYEAIRRAEGRPPRLDEFDANLDQLLRRFLHYLTDEQEAALYKLSVCSTFDLVRYRDLMQTFGTGYPATADGLKRLRAFSFVEEPEPGRYALHDLVRKALEHADDFDERRRVHEHLLAQATTILDAIDVRAVTEEDERALREAFEHQQVLLEPRVFINWYSGAEDPLYHAARWSVLQPLREDILSILEAEVGIDHPATLSSMNNLAYTLQMRGALNDAKPVFHLVLSRRIALLGKDHHDTLLSLSNYANLLHDLGDLDEAEPLYRSALSRYEFILGRDHPDTLRTVSNLGSLLLERGDYTASEPFILQALLRRERILGPEHPDTLLSAGNLGGYYLEIKDYKSALLLFQRTLTGYQDTFGENHPRTLLAANNVAFIRFQLGDYSGVEPVFRQLLGKYKASIGKDHPDTLRCAINLAGLLDRRGNLAEARILYYDTLDDASRSLGESHPITILVRRNLEAIAKVGGRDSFGA
ncbi:MAG: tetratricopeptide repeat protein [Bacteroidota bacterium]